MSSYKNVVLTDECMWKTIEYQFDHEHKIPVDMRIIGENVLEYTLINMCHCEIKFTNQLI